MQYTILQVSAIVKNHVTRVVNSGQDASDSTEFADAVSANGGVKNTTVLFGNLIDRKTETQNIKIIDESAQLIKGITEINDITFETEGVKLQKHSLIGTGEQKKLDPVLMKFDFDCVTKCQPDEKNRAYKEYKKPGTIEPLSDKELKEKTAEEENDFSDEYRNNEQVEFKCNNELCDRSFGTSEELAQHHLDRNCSLTVLETVSKLYTDQFSAATFRNLTSQQKRSIATFLTPLDVCKVKESIPREPLDVDTDFKEGFSLKVPKPHVRFTPDQERFVKDYFDRGEESKSRKVQPEEVVYQMRRAKIQDPENRGQERFLFMKKEWLTEAQVRGLFGKFARLRTQKGKKATIGVDHDTLAAEHGEEEYKDEIVALRDRANTQQELSEQDHPLEVRIKTKDL